jgi:hypothetical protein
MWQVVQKHTVFMQQTVWPLSDKTTLETILSPFEEITLEISSVLNMRWARNFFSSEIKKIAGIGIY